MLRVSSKTVRTLAVCWKKSAVSCIRVTNLTTEIAFALSTYDALFVVNLALIHAKPQKNFGNFKAAFIEEPGYYRGVTGSTALDGAGDPQSGDFDFWAVRLRNGIYTRVRVAAYSNGILTAF